MTDAPAVTAERERIGASAAEALPSTIAAKATVVRAGTAAPVPTAARASRAR